jgi:hypothetical protein
MVTLRVLSRDAVATTPMRRWAPGPTTIWVLLLTC